MDAPKRLEPLSPRPLVSIVTPSYNQARFLEETILSVLSQDYDPIEYIVMDGGSTDGSVDILRKYGPRLAQWVSEPDEGQSDALNKGFQAARGEILGWINSDDTYRPGAVREAVRALTARPPEAMVYSACNIVDAEGNVVATQQAADYDLAAYLLEPKIPQPTAFMRADVLRDVGYLDPILHYAMDCDLWLRIGARYGARRIPGVWANFRHVAGTKTSEDQARFGPELLKVYERFFARAELAPEIAALRGRALARMQWRTGIEFYATGDEHRGRIHCANALRSPSSVLADRDYAVNRLIHNHGPYQQVLRDPDVVRRVLGEAPLSLWSKARLRRQVWARYYAGRFYRACAVPDHRRARLDGLRALLLSPALVVNRGFLSLYARSLLGTDAVERLRPALGLEGRRSDRHISSS